MSNIEKYIFIPYEKYMKEKQIAKEDTGDAKQIEDTKNTSNEREQFPLKDKVSPPPGIPDKPTGYRWLTLPETK